MGKQPAYHCWGLSNCHLPWPSGLLNADGSGHLPRWGGGVTGTPGEVGEEASKMAANGSALFTVTPCVVSPTLNMTDMCNQ